MIEIIAYSLYVVDIICVCKFMQCLKHIYKLHVQLIIFSIRRSLLCKINSVIYLLALSFNKCSLVELRLQSSVTYESFTTVPVTRYVVIQCVSHCKSTFNY